MPDFELTPEMVQQEIQELQQQLQTLQMLLEAIQQPVTYIADGFTTEAEF
jgi:prefoldin subunit 5